MICCTQTSTPVRVVPELGLDALLADPLIRLVMASDGVSEATIRGLRGSRRSGGRAGQPALVQ